MGTEQRKNPRVVAYAKAVHSATAMPGYIRDLSGTGCQVAFVQPLPIAAGDSIEVRIIAEHDPAVAAFPVRLVARWARWDGIWFCIGGELAAPGDGQERAGFASLVSYYERGAGESTSGPVPTPGAASSSARARGSRQHSRRG